METVTDWILSAGSAALLIVVISSWLTSIRVRNSAQSVSSGWFAPPT